MFGRRTATRTARATRPLVILIALAFGSAVALSGCSSAPTTHPSSTPSAVATKATSTPTPTPTPTFAAMQYTCSSLLPPGTITLFKSKASAGFALQTDYLQRMENIDSNLVTFNTYGGILCQWAYADSSSSVDYAYSPITAAEATQQEATLTSNGYAPTSKYNGTLYANSDTADYPDEYLFINGYWFQASSDDTMQLIVDNVFQESQ